MKSIKNGTICFISTVGHNNFWYPIFNENGKSLIIRDVDNVKIESWVCNNKRLKAVKIKISDVRDLYGNPNSSTIVWVDENDIKEV